jgi:hypothetical protein
LRLAREIGHAVLESHSLYQLATIFSTRGDLDRASAFCEEAVALFRHRGDIWGELNSLQAMAAIAQLRADDERVVVLARQCLIRYRELGDRRRYRIPLERLAWVARVRGDPARAGRLLSAAEAIREASWGRRPPSDQELHEREVGLVNAALGESAFMAVWAEGRAMTPDQAVAYALEEPTSTR